MNVLYWPLLEPYKRKINSALRILSPTMPLQQWVNYMVNNTLRAYGAFGELGQKVYQVGIREEE